MTLFETLTLQAYEKNRFIKQQHPMVENGINTMVHLALGKLAEITKQDYRFLGLDLHAKNQLILEYAQFNIDNGQLNQALTNGVIEYAYVKLLMAMDALS